MVCQYCDIISDFLDCDKWMFLQTTSKFTGKLLFHKIWHWSSYNNEWWNPLIFTECARLEGLFNMINVHYVAWKLFWTYLKQDCIPVGCIPPACWPYLPACTAQGMGGGGWGCLLGGGVPGPRGYLVQGGGIPACTETDPSPAHEQNSWHMLVKILPCPKLRLPTVKIAVFQPISSNSVVLNCFNRLNCLGWNCINKERVKFNWLVFRSKDLCEAKPHVGCSKKHSKYYTLP